MATSKRTKKVTKDKTLVINFVLDETGSMLVCKDATISGFNEYINELAKRPESIRFTLTKFNTTKIEVVYTGAAVEDIKPLDQSNYQPAALTPLYDAVARTIKATEQALTSIPDHAVLCVIMTDGEENASHEYDRDKIFALIKEKTDAGWTFAFLGADQDAWAAGTKIGISNNMSYTNTSDGIKGAYRTLAASTLNYAKSGGQQTDSFFGDQNNPSKPSKPVQAPKQKTKLHDW